MTGKREAGKGDTRRQPDGGRREERFYAIGDIHGCRDLIEELHDLIAEDAARAGPSRLTAVYLGDYIDRGPDPAGVLDFLLDHPLPGFANIYLKGNHEALLLGCLQDSEAGLSWILNGGETTLESYGIAAPAWMAPDEPGDLSRRLARAIPPRHLKFLRSLQSIHEQGDYCFVHAGVRPDVPPREQDEHDLLWIREPFLSHPAPLPKRVIHGHTITSWPEVRAHRIGLDTGAWITGRLSCVVLDGGEPRFLQT